MHSKNYGRKALIEYSVIIDAIAGDVTAIGKVLKHYEKYIGKLSLVKDSKSGRQVVDQQLKQTLELELIISILKFKIR